MNINDILKRQPWHISYVNIGQRCNNPNHPKYKFYGAKNIRRSITSSELKRMWYRDKAFLMKSPSVDRIDPTKDYSYDNCRYLEMEENRALAKKPKATKKPKPNPAELEKQELSIDQLRDLMSKVNRATETNVKEVENIYSPPFSGDKHKTGPYEYPSQLLGVKNGKQKIRVSGNANSGGQFGGSAGPVYGVPTGGSYLT